MSEENTEQIIRELQQKILWLRGQLPKWIDADEHPDSDRDVLIFNPSEQESWHIGYWDGELWNNVPCSWAQEEITHWMELPEPPEPTEKE